MAQRKTKTTAVDPVREAAGLDKGAPEVAESKVENTVMLDIDGMSQEQFDREKRFQVALAIYPTIARFASIEQVDDENLAGAFARVAFEYADAFIAQSRKGQVDGND